MAKVKNIFGMNVTYRRDKIADQGLAGYFHPGRKEIVLDANLKGMDLTQVTLHEEMEAIYYRLAGVQTSLSNDAKEILIDSIATFITENYSLKAK